MVESFLQNWQRYRSNLILFTKHTLPIQNFPGNCPTGRGQIRGPPNQTFPGNSSFGAKKKVKNFFLRRELLGLGAGQIFRGPGTRGPRDRGPRVPGTHGTQGPGTRGPGTRGPMGPVPEPRHKKKIKLLFGRHESTKRRFPRNLLIW